MLRTGLIGCRIVWWNLEPTSFEWSSWNVSVSAVVGVWLLSQRNRLLDARSHDRWSRSAIVIFPERQILPFRIVNLNKILYFEIYSVHDYLNDCFSAFLQLLTQYRSERVTFFKGTFVRYVLVLRVFMGNICLYQLLNNSTQVQRVVYNRIKSLMVPQIYRFITTY